MKAEVKNNRAGSIGKGQKRMKKRKIAEKILGQN